MARNQVEVSVVIPTYNRRDRLRNVLTALENQHTTVGGERGDFDFEVVVVCDGCTDGTAEMLGAMTTSYPLRDIEQENSGPAAARNRGIDESRGSTIVFIDDDVLPAPECLAAHVRHHRSAEDYAVIGPMLRPTDATLSPWVEWEQHQLDKQYDSFARNPIAHYRQFYTGNASVRRAALVEVNGFDTDFQRAEDVELAHRLHLSGVGFLFEPDARAFHYAERSYESWFDTAHLYGLNTVAFAAMGQEELLDAVGPELRQRNLLQRALVRGVLPRPRLMQRTHGVLHRSTDLAHRVGARRPGRYLLSANYGLNFYRGVAEGLGSPASFFELVNLSDPRDGRSLVAFVLEQTLGHVTHSKNLQTLLAEADDVQAVFLPVVMEDDLIRRVPILSNWTVEAGLRAATPAGPIAAGDSGTVPRCDVRPHAGPSGAARRLDAEGTDGRVARRHSAAVRRARRALRPRHRESGVRGVQASAESPVLRAVSACGGLVGVDETGSRPRLRGGRRQDYAIAPGVDVDLWMNTSADDTNTPSVPVRILFVGGDLLRKGGDVLLQAARRLRETDDVAPFEVHLVTTSEIDDEPGVVVHRGLSANSPELIAQYHAADLFCLPTRGDCLPMVLAEAGAAGLPLVSTDVGAISEVVRDGETGRLVPPGDVSALADALRALVNDERTRRSMGRRACELVERDHDARVNARRLVDVIEEYCDLPSSGVDAKKHHSPQVPPLDGSS